MGDKAASVLSFFSSLATLTSSLMDFALTYMSPLGLISLVATQVSKCFKETDLAIFLSYLCFIYVSDIYQTSQTFIKCLGHLSDLTAYVRVILILKISESQIVHVPELFPVLHWFQNTFCFLSSSTPSIGGRFFWKSLFYNVKAAKKLPNLKIV